MAHFGETPVKPVTETPEEKAKRLAGDLELAPLEGEEGEIKKTEAEEGEKTSTPVATTETPQAIAEQAEAQAVEDNAAADALVEQIKGGNVEGKATEKAENPLDAMADAQKMEQMNRGAVEFALSQNDIPGFQKAYINMSENLIAYQEAVIKNLDKSFESGNFQNRGPSSDENVKGIYVYQREQALKQIQHIQKNNIGEVEKDPESIIQRDGFEKSRNVNHLLGKLAQEAEGLLQKEDQMGYGRGKSYPHATAKLEGYVSAALEAKNTEVMRSLPSLVKRIPFSSELKKRIDGMAI